MTWRKELRGYLLALVILLAVGPSLKIWAWQTQATIHTSKGDMRFVLLPKVAPITVMNFLQLSEDQFYNGTKFHRVSRNCLIQGGDPLSRNDSPNTGMGGLSYCIPAELSDCKHVRGTLSMARRVNNPDSAGSQFFICLRDAPQYDGVYTVFGQIISGSDVLEAIGNSEVTYSALGELSQPIQPIVIESVSVMPLIPPQSPLIDKGVKVQNEKAIDEKSRSKDQSLPNSASADAVQDSQISDNTQANAVLKPKDQLDQATEKTEASIINDQGASEKITVNKTESIDSISSDQTLPKADQRASLLNKTPTAPNDLKISTDVKTGQKLPSSDDSCRMSDKDQLATNDQKTGMDKSKNVESDGSTPQLKQNSDQNDSNRQTPLTDPKKEQEEKPNSSTVQDDEDAAGIC